MQQIDITAVWKYIFMTLILPYFKGSPDKWINQVIIGIECLHMLSNIWSNFASDTFICSRCRDSLRSSINKILNKAMKYQP